MTSAGVGGMAGLLLIQMLFPVMKGESQLIGSTEPVVGLAGHHCVLPCSLKPAKNVAEKTVEWTRSDLDPSYVHIFRQGRLLYDDVNPSFLQRANLFEQELRNGNMSLKLSDLKISDTGTYTCKLITSSESFIQVSVVIGAVSEPQISLERYDDKLIFKCEAKNWYPEPKMEWRDSEGRIIPHEDKTKHDEYFSVYSSIKVDIAASDNYTCTVRQKDIRETREISYSPPEVFREVASLKISISSLAGWLIVIVLLLLFALIMGALMLIWAGRNLVRKKVAVQNKAPPEENRPLSLDQLQGEDREEEVEADGPGRPPMEQLERQNNNRQGEVELLRHQNDDLTKENCRLKEEVQKLKREIQDLREVDSDGNIAAAAEAPRTNSLPALC